MNIFCQYIWAICSRYDWYHDGHGISFWINEKSYPIYKLKS